MQAKRNISTRLLSLFLSLMLVVGLMPVSAFAESQGSETSYSNCIKGTLWLDTLEDESQGITRGNGIFDTGEELVVGYTVELFNENDTDNAVQSTQTYLNGEYEFTNISPDTYVVGIKNDSVYEKTFTVSEIGITTDNKFVQSAADNTVSFSDPIMLSDTDSIIEISSGLLTEVEAITVTESQTESEPSSEESSVSGGEITSAVISISGMIWVEDTSGMPLGDGFYDSATEVKVEGFILNLYKADDTSTVIDTAVTDSNGEYNFSNLEDGDYIVGFGAQTINDVEYLMPLSGLTGENKFVIDVTTSTQALTETITVSGYTDALDYSAGVRRVPQATPMSGTYIVAGDTSGTTIGTYTTLASAVSACVTTEPCTITATANDTAMGATVIIPSGKTITLTSDSGGPYTITQQTIGTQSTGRHIQITGGNLTLRNITLEGMGYTTSSYNGGIFMASGNLTLEDGAVIQYCSCYDYGIVWVDTAILPSS